MTDSMAPAIVSSAPQLLREVNDRIRDVERARAIAEYDLVCECGDETCTSPMRMTAAQYDEVRGEPGTYAVLPGHESAEDDVVVRHGDGYVVVRPRAGAMLSLNGG